MIYCPPLINLGHDNLVFSNWTPTNYVSFFNFLTTTFLKRSGYFDRKLLLVGNQEFGAFLKFYDSIFYVVTQPILKFWRHPEVQYYHIRNAVFCVCTIWMQSKTHVFPRNKIEISAIHLSFAVRVMVCCSDVFNKMKLQFENFKSINVACLHNVVGLRRRDK